MDQPKFSGTYIGDDGVMRPSEVHAILERIVTCESVTGHEYDAGRLIAKIGCTHGLTVERQPVAKRRENILLTAGGDAWSAPHGLLLHGHYDTVPLLDMRDALSARVRDNKMWGRGTVDQKGGLAAALAAAIAMTRLGRPFRRSLCVAAVVDEESEHRGSYALAEQGIRADYAFVTEPTNTVTAEFGCRGTTPIVIRVQGKTAHAGAPWMGVNAIEKAMPILERLFQMPCPKVDLGVLGIVRGSLCVSMIEAGTAYNNVPNEAVIRMDRRTVPGEDSAMALAEVQAVLDRVHREDPSVVATCEIARPDWHWAPIRQRGLNPTLTPVDTPLAEILQSAAAASGIGPIEPRFSNNYYDMDFLVNDLGIPTIVYGPGDGQLCHSAEEEVDLDDVCRVADVFCHVIERLCLEA